MSNWKDLGTLLMEYGLVSAADLEEGLQLHRSSGMRIGEALVQLGKISMEDVDWVLSKQLNIPFVIVEDVTPNMDLLNIFQKEFLIENRILPLYETDDQIAIAIEDPFNSTAIEHIKTTISKEVNVSTGSGRMIKNILKKCLVKEGLPELIDHVRDITEKIRDTSFYRIDFISIDNSCSMNVYGMGILRNILTINFPVSTEDIFKAFDNLGIAFLYDIAEDDTRTFIAVYPVYGTPSAKSLPFIAGTFGLCCPDGIVFSNSNAHGLPSFMKSDREVRGYSYFATKTVSHHHQKMIYTLDAAPDKFENFHVHISVPKRCTGCNGTGCLTCNDLGHLFQKIEGVYSSDELKDMLKESDYGKD